jgi:hypothetical protein
MPVFFFVHHSEQNVWIRDDTASAGRRRPGKSRKYAGEAGNALMMAALEYGVV